MTRLDISLVIGLTALGCSVGSRDGHHQQPVDTDSGFLPTDTDPGDVIPPFDTDPTNIPDIDFAMPCYDYELFNYHNWLDSYGKALAINDDNIAVGHLINNWITSSLAIDLPFRFETFGSSYNERYSGALVFNSAYYHYEGIPSHDLFNVQIVDINSAGLTIARGHHEDDEYLHAGYMDSVGVFQRLLTDETQSIPTAINDAGQVVGYHYNSYEEWPDGGGKPILIEESQGFLWHDDVTPPTYLNPLPGAPVDAQVEPHDINNAGQVVGGAVDGTGLWQAFIWEVSTGYTLLAPLGGGEAVAHGVNNQGDVVGESLDTDDSWKPVVWDATGAITNLGLLDTAPMRSGAARAVNDAGTVVGWDKPLAAFAWNRAWVWKDGVKTDPTATHNPHNNHHFAEAHDINNQGVIVGSTMMVYGDGPFAFALIPQDCDPAPDTDSGY